MAYQPIDAVWFWPLTVTPFRAVYGRLPGPYSKDYLQTSGDCSEAFDRKTGRQGDERYPVEYRWPGGATADVVKPGGGYNPPHDLRLNFRWPFSQAPAPWKLSPSPGGIGVFPGDPSRTTQDGADSEWAAFDALNTDPWLVAVKLRGEDHVLHVRAYMGRPPADRAYASLNNVPAPLLAEIRSLLRGGCGTFEPGREGQPQLSFDPDRMFDAWEAPSATPVSPPDIGLVIDIHEGSAPETGVGLEVPWALSGVVARGLPVVYSLGTGGDRTYIGAAVIGRINPSRDGSGTLMGEIVGYRAFQSPVPYQDDAGSYLEPGGPSAGHLKQAVRTVPIEIVESIIARAALTGEDESVVIAGDEGRHRDYPTSERARLIDAYAMDVAMGEARQRFPNSAVIRMPHNNPGYDIRIREAGRPAWYVEVKGTAGLLGGFYISEGERQFSERNARRYSLCVVRAIDLEATSHQVAWFDGPVDAETFGLVVRQWQGRVPQ